MHFTSALIHTLDDTAHLIGSSPEPHFVIHGHIHGALSLTRPLPSSFIFPSCHLRLLLPTSCSLSSTTRSSWQVCATPPQKRVRAPCTPPTLTHEPNLLTLRRAQRLGCQSTALHESSDQDVDHVKNSARSQRHTEVKPITANQKTMSVSQSSSYCKVRWIRAT